MSRRSKTTRKTRRKLEKPAKPQIAWGDVELVHTITIINHSAMAYVPGPDVTGAQRR